MARDGSDGSDGSDGIASLGGLDMVMMSPIRQQVSYLVDSLCLFLYKSFNILEKFSQTSRINRP